MAKKEDNNKFVAKWYHKILVRYWFVIIIIVTVSLFAFEYFFVIQPKVKQTKKGKALDVDTHQEILQEQKNYLQKLKSLKKASSDLREEELERLNYVVAGKIDLAQILSKMDTLIRQSNLEVLEYGVDWEDGEIIMNFRFTNADYQRVKKFLGRVEKNIRIMDVTNIALREGGNLVSFTIKSYYLK